MRAVDCEGFAGGFTLGAVQAGFELVGKRELPGGFGVASCEGNRHLLGDNWTTQVSSWEEWEPVAADLVFGNPPCSGFSLMSAKEFRGPDSPINSCMYAFAEYAARVRPQVAIFESVQQAYTGGRDLMQRLRALVEERTGEEWTLTHVLHNGICVGGAAIRRRYFFVISRVPFGVERMDVRPPAFGEVIGDLMGLGLTWKPQEYVQPPPEGWSAPLRNSDGTVDGHFTRFSPMIRRALDLCGDGVRWEAGMTVSDMARAYHTRHGRLPESWGHLAEKIPTNNFHMGYHQLVRWRPERAARVITGGGPQLVLHPYEDRPLTVRECFRVQGFPNSWKLEHLEPVGGASTFPGKGIPVQCGRWIATWARESILGWPGADRGVVIGDRERLVDHTNAVAHRYDVNYLASTVPVG